MFNYIQQKLQTRSSCLLFFGSFPPSSGPFLNRTSPKKQKQKRFNIFLFPLEFSECSKSPVAWLGEKQTNNEWIKINKYRPRPWRSLRHTDHLTLHPFNINLIKWSSNVSSGFSHIRSKQIHLIFFLSDSALRPSGGAADHLSQEAAFYGDASCWRAAAVCSADINCLSVKYRTVKEELWATGSCDERERERRREEGEEDGRGGRGGGGRKAQQHTNWISPLNSNQLHIKPITWL